MTIFRTRCWRSFGTGLLLCLLPPPAISETVVVRSGEHAGFARLVIRFDEQTPWQFGRVAGGYALQIERRDVQADMSRIYDLIPRDRIASASFDPAQGRLTLAVDCDCSAVAFAPDPRSVALDVRDGKADPGSPFERALNVDSTPLPEMEEEDPENATPRAPLTGGRGDSNLAFFWRNQPVPETTLSPRQSTRADAAPDMERPNPQHDQPDTPPQLPPLPAPDLSAGLAPGPTDGLRDDLLLQLSRATAQGLVSPVEDRLLSAAEIAATAIPATPTDALRDNTAKGDLSEDDAGNAKKPASHLRIRTDTAVDQATGISADDNETDKGLACPADSLLDLTGWAQPDDVAGQIAGFNRALVGEFDAPDPAAVSGYIRLYLSLGFGAEAKALMREFPDERRDDSLLVDLANILDRGSAPGSALAGMQSCPGNAALWSVLAEPRLNPSVTVNRASVIAGFSALPLHLRRHLFPELSRRFLDAGDNDMATALRAALTRTGEGHGDKVKIADADLAAASGNIRASNAILQEIIAGGAVEAPEALVRMIDLQVSQGEQIDQGTVASVETLAYEHHGTPLGARLAKAYATAAAANGALDEAFAAITKLEPQGITKEDSRRMASAISLGLANATDATFMRIVLMQMPYLSSAPLPPESRLALADRMLTLGMPAHARDILASIGTDTAAAIVLAKAHLAQGDAAAAIAVLGDRQDTEAQAILAQALALMGDHVAAATARAKASEDGDGLTNGGPAWLAGDWAAVAQAGDGVRQAAARLVATGVMEPTPDADLVRDTTSPGTTGDAADALAQTSGPLARAAGLVAESRSARDTIRALLADSQLSEP